LLRLGAANALRFTADLSWGDAGVVDHDGITDSFPSLLHVLPDKKVLIGGLGHLPDQAPTA
jgi:hypothetical protein